MLTLFPRAKAGFIRLMLREIADGRIYGRGTMDDKGPAVCAIYALAAIKAAGIPMRRRVRIILGTNEETGWGCMDHYRKVAEIPTLTFSPDAWIIPLLIPKKAFIMPHALQCKNKYPH